MSEKQLKHFQNKQAYFQAVPTSFRQVLGLSVPRCGKNRELEKLGAKNIQTSTPLLKRGAKRDSQISYEGDCVFPLSLRGV